MFTFPHISVLLSLSADGVLVVTVVCMDPWESLPRGSSYKGSMIGCIA